VVNVSDTATRLTVTAFVPSYNHGRFLRFALESIFAQSRLPDEILVVDDGSTDETAALLEQYARRITFYVRPHEGIGATYNFGVRVAQGDVLAFLESDDAWDERYLAVTVRILENRPEIAWVSTARCPIDANGTVIGPPSQKPSRGPFFTTATILRSDLGFSPTPVVRRRALLGVGPFRTDTYAVDCDMMLRFSLVHRMLFVDAPLYLYRLHGANTSKNSLANAREILRVLEDFARDREYDAQLHGAVRECLAKYQGRVAVMAMEEDPVGAQEEIVRLLGEAVRNHPTKLKHLRRWVAVRLLGPERYGRWRDGLKKATFPRARSFREWWARPRRRPET